MTTENSRADALTDRHETLDERIARESAMHVNLTIGQLYDGIEAVLSHYRLSNWMNEHEDALGLVDRLCDHGAQTIESGKNEIRLIVDEIYNEVLMPAALAASPVEQPAQSDVQSRYEQLVAKHGFTEYVRGYGDCLARMQTATQPAATPAPAPADERAAFEHHERASNLERDDEGDYVNPCVQSAWEGWQARAASASETGAEGAKICESCKFTLPSHEFDCFAAVPDTKYAVTPEDDLEAGVIGRQLVAVESLLSELLDKIKPGLGNGDVTVGARAALRLMSERASVTAAAEEVAPVVTRQIIDLVESYGGALLAQRTDEAAAILECIRASVANQQTYEQAPAPFAWIRASVPEHFASPIAYSAVTELLKQQSGGYLPIYLDPSRSPAMAAQPRAWETDDGRVISDEQKQQALRDGGASASSVRPFSIPLGRINAVPAMAAEAQTDWRELSRRLYVELFHCDQQMRSTRDEDGEPHWTQSAVVRDVLANAKAALDLPIGTLGALFAIQRGFGAQAAMAAEAVAWVRKHPDTGELSGDWLWNDVIEQCRKDSGVWFPVGFLAAHPGQPDPRAAVTDDDKVCADRYRWLRSQMKVGSTRTDLPLYRALYWVGLEPCTDLRDADEAIDAARAGGAS